jgi:hypothetical protein
MIKQVTFSIDFSAMPFNLELRILTIWSLWICDEYGDHYYENISTQMVLYNDLLSSSR